MTHHDELLAREGMVMVPREPTWQMCDAGVVAAGKGYMDHEKISTDDADNIYRAMLAVAALKGWKP